MAQLPPRVPSMPFPPPHHNHHPPAAAVAASWVDDFLDFTSARRGNHRRSMSDSIAFLEPPSHGGGGAGFDRFDDDQLMSMFSDDFSAAGGLSVVHPLGSPKSDPSSPNSDRNSNADPEKPVSTLDLAAPVAAKAEHGEVESSCNDDDVDDGPQKPDFGAPATESVDPKRVKRILANRQSAQRSRVRKLQYISELERSVTTLQTEVSALSPRVAFLDHQRLILNVDNSAIKQRIAALAQDKIFKDAHQEALKKEIERLRQIYHHQNMKKLSNNNNHSTGNGEGASDNSPLTDQKMQLITS